MPHTASSVPLNWKASVDEPRAMVNQGVAVRWLAFFAVTVAGAIADLWTKQWVFTWRGLPGEKPIWWIVEGYVGIETAVNPGALFGMGAGFGLGFAALSVVAGVAVGTWLYRYRAIDSWWLLVALAFVMGGIIGNLYDRLGLWQSHRAVCYSRSRQSGG